MPGKYSSLRQGFGGRVKIINIEGSALLLAMLVMASILTVSVATSTLVINEVQQSMLLDKSIVAFYGAESGVERGLFQVRHKNFNPADLSNATKTLSNNASYQLAASNTEEAIYGSLIADESYQLDLYNPDSFEALANPIKAVRLAWDGAGSWLEIKWTPWTTAGVLDDPKMVYLSQASSPAIVQLYDSSAYLYRMRLIARAAGIANLAITAYNNVDPVANCVPLASCQVPIPGRVSIKGIGVYPANSINAANQAILVTMPIKSPLSGLYDYVLYSEEDVKKEN